MGIFDERVVIVTGAARRLGAGLRQVLRPGWGQCGAGGCERHRDCGCRNGGGRAEVYWGRDRCDGSGRAWRRLMSQTASRVRPA